MQVKVKSQGLVVNRAIYLAFGVNLQGLKEVLGMWAAEAEGELFRDADNFEEAKHKLKKLLKEMRLEGSIEPDNV